MRSLLRSLVLILAAGVISVSSWAAVPSLINYQGRVTDASDNPVPDGVYVLSFGIFATETGGTAVWSETQANITVANGFFSVLLGSVTPIGDNTFADPDRWLEISVAGQPITPRTRITSVAYSQRIGTVDGAAGGVISDSIVIASGLGTGADRMSSAAAAATIIIKANVGSPSSVGIYEPVDSRAGAFSLPQKKVEILSDGLIMFGQSENDTTLFIKPNGDIVGLGQITMGQNSSSGTQTTVLGFQNTASGDTSTVGGGTQNTAGGTLSVVAGGRGNEASGTASVISGGAENSASGQYAVVAGGLNNTAAGDFGIVAGGADNSAAGEHAYAAGKRAKALHDGAFVWADNTDADFSSTGEDQFLIRAAGGVGIGTDNPRGALEVVADPGDSAVILPNSSISAEELVNEPGIATERFTGPLTLAQKFPNMITVTSATVIAPEEGYVVVRAGGTFIASGTSGANQAYFQVDETVGGGIVAPYYTVTGDADHGNPNANYYYSFSVERIYAVPAGTRTFHLEGQTLQTNSAQAWSRVINAYVTATYYPTSYGPVTTASTTAVGN